MPPLAASPDAMQHGGRHLGGRGRAARVDHRFHGHGFMSWKPAAVCSRVLFVYFTHVEQAYFALSPDGRHFESLNAGQPIPELRTQAPHTLRDPFLNLAEDGVYHLVSTDGHGSGGPSTGSTVNVLHWTSRDLVTWSAQEVLPVMAKYRNESKNLWAPEWVYHRESGRYLLFWATSWHDTDCTTNRHFDRACTNRNCGRFAFWGSWTADWKEWSDPVPVFDPDCMSDWYAPWLYGDGGIDGHIYFRPAGQQQQQRQQKDAKGGRLAAWEGAESASAAAGSAEEAAGGGADDEGGGGEGASGAGGQYHFFFKSTRAPAPGMAQEQKTSGTRISQSGTGPDALLQWSPVTAEGLASAWGSEGPELLDVNGTLHQYYDCTFQPAVPGWPRPPYGVSVATSPAAGMTDPAAWNEVPGSCRGNGTGSLVNFPSDATHGGFICVSDATAAAMRLKWP
uniref:Glycosyl hydrolase family 32 N-terminal domain-containing protein n=1 Tax=Alexandrium monilatum TaxID=311494 RepID=A0A7S4SFL5_9DINO